MPRNKVEVEIGWRRPGTRSYQEWQAVQQKMFDRAHELRRRDHGSWGRAGSGSLRTVARMLLDEGLTGGVVISPAALARMLARNPPRDPGETNDSAGRRGRSFVSGRSPAGQGKK